MLKRFLLLLFCCTCCIFTGHTQLKEDSCVLAIQNGTTLLNYFKPGEAASFFRLSARLARELQNDSLLGLALLGEGQALWYQGDFHDALDTVNLSIQYLKKKAAAWQTAVALRIISNIYDDLGNYEKALETVSEALDLYNQVNDDKNKLLSLVQLGGLYRSTGDYPAALDYYQKALAMNPPRGDYANRELNYHLGDFYADRMQLDSAWYFYNNALQQNPRSKASRVRMGRYYLLQNNMDSAFHYLWSVYQEAKAGKDVNVLLLAMLHLGKVYFRQNKLAAAENMAQGIVNIAAAKGIRQNKRDAYLLLSSIYEARNQAAQALYYYKQYVQLKDSVISDQFKGQLYTLKRKAADEKQLAAIRILNNEKMLADHRLKESRQQRNILAGSILAICLLGMVVFFNISLRHKNEKLYFRQKSSALEMQALRAQMNPHFIFNCLSAVNHFILNGETDKASDYLTRFSRLMRLVLVTAGKATISLEEELTMLRLYLEMEQLRFKDAFDYHIYLDEAIQPSLALVPSFILQPFCENAIWHGLLHKEGKGLLAIHLRQEKDKLVCTITDNGIGRARAAAIKTMAAEKRTSLGHKLSAERLSLFNGENFNGSSFVIEDVKDEQGTVTGTMVTLKMPNKPVYD